MDKRITKSIEKIKTAYLDLLFKNDPSDIQVIDLCQAAGVNRSTFYDRFGYLDKLVEEIIEDEVKYISFIEYQLDSLPVENHGISKYFIKIYIQRFCKSKILMRFCMVENRAKYVDIILHKQIELSANALSKISYYNAYFQTVGALATIIEWVNNPNGQSLDDLVEIVYNHSIAMFA